ncbi:MAG TPA: copper resistance protein NlpE N-terminal domain-containing protein, partial [Flavobacterium sp.]|nr:copper resistance protein NlpE N-terminal domain-containing protein [Flavobacterium sp.]
DYLGVYKGKLPCADCTGIETSLELSEDFTYLMTSKYLGKKVKTLEQKGTFSWNEAENAIVLDNKGHEPVQYLVGNNTLTQLDMSGKKITGKLAPNFILKKIPEAEAAKIDATPQKVALVDITNIHWKLAELNGKPVKNDGEKPYFIEFKANNNFSAFAGCNGMSGHYEYSASRIRFMRVMATMKACADMQVEDQFKIALETADNFVSNQKVLQLRKGETTVAKFEAASK